MANRYWVGSTGVWSYSGTGHWATTSGGTATAAAPTNLDDVFFDSNSGAGIVTVSNLVRCLSLNTTGFLGSIAGVSTPKIDVYGDITNLDCTFNISNGPEIRFVSDVFGGVQNCNITSTVRLIIVNPTLTSTVTVVLGNNLTCSYVYLVRGNFDLSGYDVTGGFYTNGTLTRKLFLRNGTWTIPYTGSSGVEGQWDTDSSSGLSIDSGTSTIALNGGSSIIPQYFRGAGYTYHNLFIGSAPSSGAIKIITGSNTFSTISGGAALLTKLTFAASSTQTVVSFDVNGSAGSLTSILSTSTGSKFTLSSSNAQSVDFLSIKDSIAVGPGWTAESTCIDSGGNSGWIFTPAASGMLVFF